MPAAWSTWCCTQWRCRRGREMRECDKTQVPNDLCGPGTASIHRVQHNPYTESYFCSHCPVHRPAGRRERSENEHTGVQKCFQTNAAGRSRATLQPQPLQAPAKPVKTAHGNHKPLAGVKREWKHPELRQQKEGNSRREQSRRGAGSLRSTQQLCTEHNIKYAW